MPQKRTSQSRANRNQLWWNHHHTNCICFTDKILKHFSFQTNRSNHNISGQYSNCIITQKELRRKKPKILAPLYPGQAFYLKVYFYFVCSRNNDIICARSFSALCSFFRCCTGWARKGHPPGFRHHFTILGLPCCQIQKLASLNQM